MLKQLKIYRKPNGKEPFVEWFSSIKDKITKAHIQNRLNRLELGNFGDCKKLGDGVSELRVHYGAGYRVYFAEYNDHIILLLIGGNKGTQTKDIEKAKMYCANFKESYDDS